MGTAPPQGPPVTMPDPVRVVSKSITMQRARGTSPDLALDNVMAAARGATVLLRSAGITDLGWLGEIEAEAFRRRSALYPPEY
jgi:hypothetical protein